MPVNSSVEITQATKAGRADSTSNRTLVKASKVKASKVKASKAPVKGANRNSTEGSWTFHQFRTRAGEEALRRVAFVCGYAILMSGKAFYSSLQFCYKLTNAKG
jgi:hypothetical protein